MGQRGPSFMTSPLRGSTYRCFGLLVRSDVDLPAPIAQGAEADEVALTLRVGPREGEGSVPEAERAPLPWFRSAERGLGDRPLLEILRRPERRAFEMRFDDGARFEVSDAGDQVWRLDDARPPASPDAAYYLFDEVMGFVLRRRGLTCLHASASDVGGEAFLFLGASGAGKSSLALELAERGHGLLADDLVVLEERGGDVLAHASHLRVRTWDRRDGAPEPEDEDPDGKLLLRAGSQSLPFTEGALSVSAVYCLDVIEPGPHQPRIGRLHGSRAVDALLGNVYAASFLPEDAWPRELALLARLADAPGVRRLLRVRGRRTALAECVLEEACTSAPQAG